MTDLGFTIQRVHEVLRTARAQRATDVTCKVDQRIGVMIDKRYTLADTVLSKREIQAAHDTWLSEDERAVIAGGEPVFVEVDDDKVGGRLRFTAALDEEGPTADFRILPRGVPNLEQLDLPKAVEELWRLRYGLVMLQAPPSNAKTTIAHAWIDSINRHETRHILTAEWPPEFRHAQKRALISSQHIGRSTASATTTAMGARRRNGQVVYIAELYDLDSARGALRAAATGLVFTTMHGVQTPGAVEAFIEMFPIDEQPQVRVWMAEHLAAVVGCRLLPKAREPGMVIATELLKRSDGVKAHIMDRNYPGLTGDIQTGSSVGMHLLEQRLALMVARRIVDEADARREVTRESIFDARLDEEKRSAA